MAHCLHISRANLGDDLVDDSLDFILCQLLRQVGHQYVYFFLLYLGKLWTSVLIVQRFALTPFFNLTGNMGNNLRIDSHFILSCKRLATEF